MTQGDTGDGQQGGQLPVLNYHRRGARRGLQTRTGEYYFRTFGRFFLVATALLSAASCWAAFAATTELAIGLGAASLLSMCAGILLWTRQD